MKKLAFLFLLFGSPLVLASDWQFSSANKAESKGEYLENLRGDRKGTTERVLNNVEESLILQTRFMNEPTKERFLTRFNKLQGTNYNVKELNRLSELYADRKQMELERNNKDVVVAYQFNSEEERQESLRKQAIRQQQAKDKAKTVEDQGRDFMKDLRYQQPNLR